MVAFSSAHLSRGPGPRVSRERCPRPDPASPSRRLRLDLRTGRPSVHRPITRAVPGDSGQRSHLPTALQLSPQRMHRLRARRPSHGRAGCWVAALGARPDSASHPWSSTQEEPPYRVTLSPAPPRTPHPTTETPRAGSWHPLPCRLQSPESGVTDLTKDPGLAVSTRAPSRRKTQSSDFRGAATSSGTHHSDHVLKNK